MWLPEEESHPPNPTKDTISVTQRREAKEPKEPTYGWQGSRKAAGYTGITSSHDDNKCDIFEERQAHHVKRTSDTMGLMIPESYWPDFSKEIGISLPLGRVFVLKSYTDRGFLWRTWAITEAWSRYVQSSLWLKFCIVKFPDCQLPLYDPPLLGSTELVIWQVEQSYDTCTWFLLARLCLPTKLLEIL